MLQNKAGLDLTVSKTGGLVSLNFFVKLSMCSHGVLPPKLWGSLFVCQKFFELGWRFFSSEEGVHMGDLLKWLWRGDSILKTWLVYLFFHFLNLGRLYICIILIVMSYVYYYVGIYVSKIWTWPNNISCTDDFLILWVWYLFNFIVVNEGDWPYQKSQASGE